MVEALGTTQAVLLVDLTDSTRRYGRLGDEFGIFELDSRGEPAT
jgi:hypothetical protein